MTKKLNNEEHLRSVGWLQIVYWVNHVPNMNKRLNDDEYQNWPKPIKCSKWTTSWTCLIFPNPFKRYSCLSPFVAKLHPSVSHTVAFERVANARITIGFMIATMPKMNVGVCVLEAKTIVGLLYVRFSGYGWQWMSTWTLQREDANKEYTTNWLITKLAKSSPV